MPNFLLNPTPTPTPTPDLPLQLFAAHGRLSHDFDAPLEIPQKGLCLSDVLDGYADMQARWVLERIQAPPTLRHAGGNTCV